jgi:hypothetical protein
LLKRIQLIAEFVPQKTLAKTNHRMPLSVSPRLPRFFLVLRWQRLATPAANPAATSVIEGDFLFLLY